MEIRKKLGAKKAEKSLNGSPLPCWWRRYCLSFSSYHKFVNVSSISRPNHAEGVYIIRNLLRYGIATKERMESSRSDVWNQSEGEIHAGAWCHTPAAIPYTLRVITYQSFGLDKKRTKRLLRSFFGRGRRIRTRDPRFWRPVLYQLSYTPVCCFFHNEHIISHLSRFCNTFFKKSFLKSPRPWALW